MDKMDNKTLTVLSDHTSVVEVSWGNSKPCIKKSDVQEVLGWELKDEGLCKETTCVPVPSDLTSDSSEFVDLLTLTEALGFSTVVDIESGFLAIDTFSSLRHSALSERKAPDIKLPDLDGTMRSLSEWSDKKKLLVAFSSW
ncbi:MAG: hypothetical protein CL469_03905 [Acidimicrobiaceae bacterium]|uniref:Uncharacterized protein n=1 Tax=marine metagenome TaxID=408172 RepID=A0A382EJN5_9ZZZZ|nr:hypothetical protein [Acidimicrobiaceae bacterium]